MIRLSRPVVLTLLCAAAASAGQAAHGATVVTAMDLRRIDAATELSVEVTGSTRPHLFTLDDPHRVVLDLAPARLAPSVHAPRPAPGVMAVRVAPHDGGGLRIVVELPKIEGTRLSTVPAGHGRERLVVRVGPPAPGAAHADAASGSATAAAATGAAAALPAATAGAPAQSEARPVRSLDTQPARALVIAVDAGHGGEDPGATGKAGTHEKAVTLAVAKALAARINAEPGMRAYLTRDGDYFVPLRTRIVHAAQAHADLFVSIHADAVADRDISGASVYVLSAHGASSEAARRLADRENAADLAGGVSLKDKDPLLASVLLDLSQSASMSASEVAAESVLHELDLVGDVRKSQVQRAGFLVLKSPDIPSMLIETAYITNPDEERRLRDPQHQGEIADAILTGLKAYFRAHPPPGLKLTGTPAPALADLH